jgi:hypothetical protein
MELNLYFYQICLNYYNFLNVWTLFESLEKMKVHCAPWAKVYLASSPAQHIGWLGLGW